MNTIVSTSNQGPSKIRSLSNQGSGQKLGNLGSHTSHLAQTKTNRTTHSRQLAPKHLLFVKTISVLFSITAAYKIFFWRNRTTHE
jgi:hypothetical protein